MQTSEQPLNKKSHKLHLILLASVLVIGMVMIVQKQVNHQIAVDTPQPQTKISTELVTPVSLTQEEIAVNVYSLQAQPTVAPAYTVIYSGEASFPRNISLKQNDRIAITNTTPNEIIVSFSSGSQLSLGAGRTLENTLGTIGDEIITIDEGQDSSQFTVIVSQT